MKINISVYGYFGSLLAREMNSLGYLGMVYTNLPAGRLKDISRVHVKSNPFYALPYALNNFGFHRFANFVSWGNIQRFDEWASANLVHCDIFYSYSSFGLATHRTAKKRFGAKTIVERGSTHIQYQETILKEEYEIWGLQFPSFDQRIVEKELLEYEECDCITVQSTFAKKTFLDMGVHSDKIVTIPVGIDLSIFKPGIKKDKTFRVMYVGTLSIRKGIGYLLEAISILVGMRLKNFEFVINGHISKEIENIVKPYRHFIRNVGKRPKNQLFDLYSQASVVVVPTIEDGFAAVVTEAMACKVPIIATTNCCGEDVISDGYNGFLIPIRNSHIIVEKILLLYNDRDFQTFLASNAYTTSKNFLGMSSHATKAKEVYSSLLLK